MRPFVADDWAEGHHDAELMDEAGGRKSRASGAVGAALI
jgi:hypothetical protein